jgi:hypothetical protein
MRNQTIKDGVILPKGTIVKLNGIPCELGADTTVVSTVLSKQGLHWVQSQGGSHEVTRPDADSVKRN